MGTAKPLFLDLNPDDPDQEPTEIESLCMNCHANGITRLLLTKIPFYKEVVLMSFSCEECGYHNNELQSGGSIAEQGIHILLNLQSKKDLNRQVVRSDYTSVKIVELDFEIPAKSQKGEITTVEGILDRSIAGLEQDQSVRKVQNPDVAINIEQFIEKLKNLKEVNGPFTMVLDDISGNSFVENFNQPHPDPQVKMTYFTRTTEQDHDLGIFTKEEVASESEGSSMLKPIPEGEFTLEDLQGEVLQFQTNCSSCGSPCQTNMKMTNVPHFKDVVIMATNCDVCGVRTNEVKSGGGIEPRGLCIEVAINSKDDFSRDVLKSETCGLKIPELDLDVGPHALGGRFTTVEGLIAAVKEQLGDPKRSHMFGDSQDDVSKARFENFLKKFDEILDGKLKVTLVLDDPAGNSYIQNMSDDDNIPDDGLKITYYERSFDQNEELGLNDMKTENY